MSFETVSFGVGSLFLQVKDSEREAEWENVVAEALGKIPSVDDIKIDTSKRRARFEALSGADPNDSQVISQAIPTRGSIRFSLQIPKRTQVELSIFRSAAVSESGKFEVIILMDGDYPVTFVFPKDVGRNEDVATAVVVVREFLEKELGKLGEDSPVLLKCLGPSPFHAEFHVSSGVGENLLVGGLSYSHFKARSYDQYEIFCDDQEFPDQASALDAVIAYLMPEFGMFYFLGAQRYLNYVKFSSIAAEFDRLTSQSISRSFKSRIRTVSIGSSIRDIRILLLQFQSRVLSVGKYSRGQVDSLDSTRPVTVLKNLIEEMLERDFENQIETFEKTLSLLDSSHTQTIQRVTSFAVSLLGVFVGAILTAWLRK
ncbi:hypothetical protein EDD99_3920 [Streptomyces sp. 846.5]|nr:hypothetical protein [Streptomyces sp. 846.5]TDU05409.1 hypothetical protein EDD99_3920 [Streptomyces sp. 846.5]